MATKTEKQKSKQKEEIEQKFKIKWVKKGLFSLKEAEYNPRKISDEAREGLRKSIERFGYLQPIIYNKTTGNIIGGHQRLNVLIDLSDGKDELIDAIEIEVDEKEEKAINITLNNHHIQGNFDYEKLPEILVELRQDLHYFDDIRLDIVNLDIDLEKAKINIEERGPLEKREQNKHGDKKLSVCPNCGYGL